MRRSICFAMILAGLAIALPAAGEGAPPSGTFTGYYRVDRWGAHTFAGVPLEPAARKAFEPFKDQLVTANITQIDQMSNPGSWFFSKVGKITPVADTPVEIKIAWADPKDGQPTYRRIDRGGNIKFTVEVTNKTGKALNRESIASDGFFLGGLFGGNLPPKDVSWDMTTMRGPFMPSTEWKESGFDLAAGKSTKWTVAISKAKPFQFDFTVYFMEYWQKKDWRRIQSNVLSIDVVEDQHHPAGNLEVELQPSAARPPRVVPAKLAVKNAGTKPVNFFLPYRGEKLAEEQLVRCFDDTGVLLQGPQPLSLKTVWGQGDFEYKPQRLEPGKALVLDVTLAGGTTLAVGSVRGGIFPPAAQRKAEEDYFLEGASVSPYVRVGQR